MTDKAAGLAGVIAGESAIATVGQEGKGLTYRGYDIDDLAAKASFEEVAYLLIHGHLPNQKELNAYIDKLVGLRNIPKELKNLLDVIPKNSHPMDVLRTATSMLGNLEPEEAFSQQYNIADRLLALYPGIICYWYAKHHQNRTIDGDSDEKTIGGHFLKLLHDKTPAKIERDMMNVSLILYAEHEFNASTFAARVTAATLSDFYSAITSAIGTLRGPLHGGANEAAMALIEKFKNPDDAEMGLMKMLSEKATIMGFGHRVYKDCDPRSDVIKQWSEKLGKEKNELLLYQISERIEAIMRREKKLFPNLDFYSASAYHYCDIPTSLFTPIFVMSRITGWSAHVFEQRSNNRLIRPSSIYTGPSLQKFIPIDMRA
ncbi:MAG: 2-methylcitrate synthase [Proteobacteria bacterium]|nr:2-methylcitrate synthase [Pseudomonadota bacterium]